jgi:hypothetical protein
MDCLRFLLRTYWGRFLLVLALLAVVAAVRELILHE